MPKSVQNNSSSEGPDAALEGIIGHGGHNVALKDAP